MDQTTEIERIGEVTRYGCMTCHAVWCGPAKYCPGCGREVSNVLPDRLKPYMEDKK